MPAEGLYQHVSFKIGNHKKLAITLITDLKTCTVHQRYLRKKAEPESQTNHDHISFDFATYIALTPLVGCMRICICANLGRSAFVFI